MMRHSPRNVRTGVSNLFHQPSRVHSPWTKKVPDTFHSAARRTGFTLLELILAIALSATLLALIGTAINLYLMRVDASRTRVEEAQLARSILATIAGDLRAASIYQPKDTSSMAALVARSASSDDDSDEESGGPETPSGADSAGSATSVGSAGSSSVGSSFGGGTAEGGDEPEGTLPLGVNGSLAELYVDVTRLPRRDELFSTNTGYTNAPLPLPPAGAPAAITARLATVPPSDVRTVRYFLRQGEPIDPGSEYTSPSPAEPSGGTTAGLVRQEIPRCYRLWAEQSGNSALLETGQTLLAPEVVHLEFRYYDGQQVADQWDMRDERALPLAIEVRIWLMTLETVNSAATPRSDLASLVAAAREYRQTVYLPMAALSGAEQGGAAGGASSSFSESSSGTSASPTSSGGNSNFGQPQ